MTLTVILIVGIIAGVLSRLLRRHRIDESIFIIASVIGAVGGGLLGCTADSCNITGGVLDLLPVFVAVVVAIIVIVVLNLITARPH
jgi:uncharacterized membrane protein YeaQ/YmgE (transglycosylase-associated protein family)